MTNERCVEILKIELEKVERKEGCNSLKAQAFKKAIASVEYIEWEVKADE